MTAPDVVRPRHETPAGGIDALLAEPSTRAAGRGGAPTPDARRVLVVDDDPATLALVEALLRADGAEPVVADCAEQARRFIQEDGAYAFDAVVTDQMMPVETGLELLSWVHDVDPTLAVVVLTAARDRETLAGAMRRGAVAFVEKPVTARMLLRDVRAAADRTQRQRSARHSTTTLREVGRLQRCTLQREAAKDPRLTVRHFPHDEAGGDFIVRRADAAGGLMLLVGDVSGHDVVSAFTAAHFQGFVSGQHELGRPVAEVLQGYGEHLLALAEQDCAAGDLSVSHSVAACALEVDAAGQRVTVTNAGAPLPVYVSPRGRVHRLEQGGHPLGWFADPPVASRAFDVERGGKVMVWTDGLEQLADRTALDPLTVATALLLGALPGGATLRARQEDDILVATAGLVPVDRDRPTHGTLWLPVFAERIAGDRMAGLDALQDRLSRAIRIVAPDIGDSRFNDLLVVAREAVINGMLHGCGGRGDLEVEVQAALLPQRRLIRLLVEDPGPGHDFDPMAHDASGGDELVDLHRGLLLIHRLATCVTALRRGATLRLDFRF